jgi:hypothetical protein
MERVSEKVYAQMRQGASISDSSSQVATEYRKAVHRIAFWKETGKNETSKTNPTKMRRKKQRWTEAAVSFFYREVANRSFVKNGIVRPPFAAMSCMSFGNVFTSPVLAHRFRSTSFLARDRVVCEWSGFFYDMDATSLRRVLKVSGFGRRSGPTPGLFGGTRTNVTGNHLGQILDLPQGAYEYSGTSMIGFSPEGFALLGPKQWDGQQEVVLCFQSGDVGDPLEKATELGSHIGETLESHFGSGVERVNDGTTVVRQDTWFDEQLKGLEENTAEHWWTRYSAATYRFKCPSWTPYFFESAEFVSGVTEFYLSRLQH